MKGGKLLGVGVEVGGVLGGWGRWRRRKRVEVGVMKAEMWEEANWSVRLRYLVRVGLLVREGGGLGGRRAHLVVGPLELVGEVEAAVDDEGVHVAGFGGEAGDAVAALFGGAEFELEERLVVSADYAEVVGHDDVAGEED